MHSHLNYAHAHTHAHTCSSPFVELLLPVDHNTDRQNNHHGLDLVHVKQAWQECNDLYRFAQPEERKKQVQNKSGYQPSLNHIYTSYFLTIIKTDP